MNSNINFFNIITIVGSLGFFIYGMKVMSEGIQKVAGSKMRSFLDKMTASRWSSILTGFLTTSVVQSSSATTVMIVSFVNAGLLSLRQAIGVIMGANIGTTMTAWLIAFVGFQFKISEYAYPILGIGVPLLFFKQDKLKFLGEFLTGLGLLFIGLDSLKHAFEVIDLKNNQEFIRFVSTFGDDGLRTTLLFVLIGSVLTVIVQSSSAAMALTLTMIDSGLPLHLAAAIVLGENIGTTVTANFAAMVANTHAKRAARAHFIFNIFGAIWMICIFDKFIHVVYNFINETCHAYLPMETNKDVIRYSLAFFHTSFNIINTLLLVGFIPQIEKIVIKIVPTPKSKPDKLADDFKLEYISAGLFNTSELGLLEAEKELEKFAKITQNMLHDVEKLLMTDDSAFTEKIIVTIKQQEVLTDQFEEEIIKYLTRLSTTGLSDSSSVELRSMLSITYDLERIGDLCCNISNEFREKNETHTIFTAEHKKELLETIHYIHQGFEVMLHNFQIAEKSPIDLSPAYLIESNIDTKRQQQRKNYLEKIKNSAAMNVSSEISYNNIFYFLARIGNHLINVSEALAGKI